MGERLIGSIFIEEGGLHLPCLYESATVVVRATVGVFMSSPVGFIYTVAITVNVV